MRYHLCSYFHVTTELGVSGCQDAKFQTGIETGAVGARRIANWKGPQDKTKLFKDETT